MREESMSATTKWRMISKVQKSCEKFMYDYDYQQENGKVIDADVFHDRLIRVLNEDKGWKYARTLYVDYTQSQIFIKVCKRLKLIPINIEN